MKSDKYRQQAFRRPRPQSRWMSQPGPTRAHQQSAPGSRDCGFLPPAGPTAMSKSTAPISSSGNPKFACNHGSVAARGGPTGQIAMNAAATYDSSSGAISFSGSGLKVAGATTRFSGKLQTRVEVGCKRRRTGPRRGAQARTTLAATSAGRVLERAPGPATSVHRPVGPGQPAARYKGPPDREHPGSQLFESGRHDRRAESGG